MATVTTEQAPAAKLVGDSVALTTVYLVCAEAPDYDIPVVGFGNSRRIAPGVIEFSSPLVITNIATTTRWASVQIVRASVTSMLLNSVPIPKNDALIFPINGQILQTGDQLQARAEANNSLRMTFAYTVGQAEEDDVA